MNTFTSLIPYWWRPNIASWDVVVTGKSIKTNGDETKYWLLIMNLAKLTVHYVHDSNVYSTLYSLQQIVVAYQL